jgi:hypothetical protein
MRSVLSIDGLVIRINYVERVVLDTNYIVNVAVVELTHKIERVLREASH